ncbi:hypothetical protein DERP_009286 [Dermatophagoides pteronyssinus]|uniref:Secreted protein n=1 Tax=Dermatophagoides pteronyssinus TaxID=6956 RepID=A0ABQ8ITD6_DERPT|nr:hypothetical protein DERP_009286 [Dermatophagoides pteronyssinus]
MFFPLLNDILSIRFVLFLIDNFGKVFSFISRLPLPLLLSDERIAAAAVFCVDRCDVDGDFSYVRLTRFKLASLGLFCLEQRTYRFVRNFHCHNCISDNRFTDI